VKEERERKMWPILSLLIYNKVGMIDKVERAKMPMEQRRHRHKINQLNMGRQMRGTKKTSISFSGRYSRLRLPSINGRPSVT
jgi:hypothetical protein